MHPVLTKAALSHTLACFLVYPIYHDVFHAVSLVELVNPGNPDGAHVTDRLGNCLDNTTGPSSTLHESRPWSTIWVFSPVLLC
jgi:hypothetical protein